MSFGFGTGFGSASSSPFGTSTAAPFGQSQPAFGQTSTPFGASSTSAGVFGQSQGFGFGAASTPAFGAASTPAFGSSAFGAQPTGFGSNQPRPFGIASAPAFGAASTPAFGGGSAFGAPPSGGSVFGQSAPSAFGASSTPAFGQTASAFGATPFGGGAGGFGSPSAGFGVAPTAPKGTRAVPWRKQQETDQSSTGAKSTVYYNNITCMPEYASKSVEELRWEDYQDGVKGNTGGVSSPAGAGGGVFGAPQPGSTPFGAAPAAPTPFGATPAFGASTSSFGAPASTPAFGGFGAASAPAFGGFGAASSAAFGASTSSPFGQSAPAFGGGFGATSTPAFGATSTPAFGAPSGTPAFGGFGATSAPAFGATSAPAFGAASSAPAFGGFGAASAPAFGAVSTPAFGAASSAPAFGGFGATSAPAFGAVSTPAFGAPSAAPAFGAPGGLFGAKPATTSGFGFNASSSSLFGAVSTPAFGAPQPSSAGLFGAASTPAFGGGGSLFGAPPPASTPGFNFASTPAQSTSFALQPMGGTGYGAHSAQQLVQPPNVSSNPYGALPEPPRVVAEANRVGLTQRPSGAAPSSSLGPPRAIALISPRSITPKAGVRMRPRQAMSASRTPSLSPMLTPGSAKSFISPIDTRMTPNGTYTPNSSPTIFVPREDPRKLFIRDPLPSTDGMRIPSASALANGGATPGPMARGGDGRTPAPLRLTPLTRGGPSHTPAKTEAFLPKVARGGYRTEPSLQQLAAIAKEDPSSLQSISNFTVVREGIGSIRWLDPIDVTGLDLDCIVNINKGSVEVYLSDEISSIGKPNVGYGLNKPAEVTMLSVFKIDKETKQPTKDAEAIEKFSRKLRKVSAEQGAKFINYDPTTGTWRFEVEHFSRYGLAEESDGESDGRSDEEMVLGVKSVAQKKVTHHQEEMDFIEEQSPPGANAESMEEGEPSDVSLQQQVDVGFLEEGEEELTGKALEVSLPAQLGLDIEEMIHIKQSLFPRNISAVENRHRQALPVKKSYMLPKVMKQETENEVEHVQIAVTSPINVDEKTISPQAAVANCEMSKGMGRRVYTALKPPSTLEFHPEVRHKAVSPPPSTVQLPFLPAELTTEALVNSSRCPISPPIFEEQGEARNLVDAGVLMGGCFRAGWNQTGMLTHQGGRGGRSSAAHVISRQLQIGGGMKTSTERARELLDVVFHCHSYWSGPVRDGGREGVGRWMVHCNRREQLSELIFELIEICQGFSHSIVDDATIIKTVINHQQDIWALVEALFSELQEEEGATAGQDDVSEYLDEKVDEEDNDGLSSTSSLQLDRLLSFKRRAVVSNWLEAVVGDRARTDVIDNKGDVGNIILAFLTGHKIDAAAAAAASSGNIRLATLIAKAGSSSEGQLKLNAQLNVWTETGFDSTFDSAVWTVYELLAGRIDDVIPALPLELDWKRALGLYIWYGLPPSASIAESVASYTESVEAGVAPAPLPEYYCAVAEDSNRSPSAHDTAFLILQLHAILEAECFLEENKEEDLAKALAPLLPRLLRPAGVTPDPLDHLFIWLLLGVLEAVGAIPHASQTNPEMLLTHMGMISQIELVGGLSHWAVYVAHFIPDETARATVIKHLLNVHCEEWENDAEKLSFFRDKLGIEVPWLCSARALLAQSRGDDIEYLNQLVQGSCWNEAHEILCSKLAPLWLMDEKDHWRLKEAFGVIENAAKEEQSGWTTAAVPDWDIGGGLYLAYLLLKEDFEEGIGAPAFMAFDEKQYARKNVAKALGKATAVWGLEKSQTKDAALRQAAFTKMAKDIKVWLMCDGEQHPSVDRALMATEVRPAVHVEVSQVALIIE